MPLALLIERSFIKLQSTSTLEQVEHCGWIKLNLKISGHWLNAMIWRPSMIAVHPFTDVSMGVSSGAVTSDFQRED